MGRTRVHGDATATALLQAAERLVEAEGVDALTVRRIADTVGVTTRAVYTTFGSKDGLLAAVGVRAFDLLATAVRRVRVTDDPAADLVRVGAGAFRDFACRHPGLFRAGFASLATPPGVWEQVAPANLQAWSALVARIERLDQAGRLGGRTVDAAATEFHCLCEGLAVNELRGNLGSARAAAPLWRGSLTALVTGWSVGAGGRVMSDDIVQRQVDAYNRHDLEGFLACYAPDAVIEWADGSQRFAGPEEIRARYAALFESTPGLHAHIAGRLRAGEWTVDEEQVQLGEDRLHVLVGYRVRGGLIDLVVMMRS